MKGTLFLLPLPLSMEADEVATPRQMELLDRAACFVVEDARTARRILRALGWMGDFHTRTWFELNEHTRFTELSPMLDACRAGQDTLLLSEAGCPAIADPGADLVALAHAEQIPVKALAGPSAILLGLMASGLNGQSFAFHGYLPKEKDARGAMIRQIDLAAQKGQTQIFIETPYRNQRLLMELLCKLSLDVRLCVACELTSPHESVITAPVHEWKKSTFDYDKKNVIFLLGR